MPYTITPAKLNERTPHRTNTDSEVRTRVVDASVHGLMISESVPNPSRPTRDAALSIASESAASFALRLMDETYARENL